MREALKQALRRVLRGRRTSAVLERLGIDPKRYWLLMDMFATLSERGEMMDQLGRSGVALDGVVLIYAFLSALWTLLLFVSHPEAAGYLVAWLGFTAVLLTSTLLSEAGNSLINPTEALVLAHQPVNGATYTAAKLSHLGRIVFYVVPAMNAIPAAAGLLVNGAAWYYPVLHLGATLALGLLCALSCCALFGWMMRFVPARRLKMAGQAAGTIPFLAMMWTGSLVHRLARWKAGDWLPAQPWQRWGLGLALIGTGAAALGLGIRTLSADYLIRVSGMVRGGAAGGARMPRARSGGLIRRFCGGQPGAAGYAFVWRMMLRDWQFRRQCLPMLVCVVAMLAPAFSGGWPKDPFARGFSAIHLLPHALGTLLFLVCSILPYGNDYKGAWIFLLVPSRAIDGFARGIHGLLWAAVAVAPNLVALAAFARRWGIRDAALFAAYSLAVSSIYLALELRMIQEAPFSRQVDPSRSAMLLPVMILGGMAIAIVVALQYFLVFRSPAIVAAVAAALGPAAYFLTRASTAAYADSIRYHLGLESGDAGKLYTKVGV